MNKAVQITLNELLDRFVASEVESGRFRSAQDVVEAGLRLLEQERFRKLREALVESEADSAATAYDRETMMESLRQSWKAHG